jgi:serine/threonine protein kinase
VKVLDFGLAKIAAADGGGPALSQSPTMTAGATRHGVILGTAAYMSPEQARGKPLDKRTDIWSFGCVLYEMLTGRSAFAGESVSDTIVAVLEREPDWNVLPDTTLPAVRRLLQRCFEKDPRRRLHDAADARIEIEDALTTPASSGPRTGRHRPRLITCCSARARMGRRDGGDGRSGHRSRGARTSTSSGGPPPATPLHRPTRRDDIHPDGHLGDAAILDVP